MSRRASVKINSELTIHIEAASDEELWDGIVETQRLFGPHVCQRCKGRNIRMVTRQVTTGRKTNTFREFQCRNKDCGAYLKISQKEGTKELFPCRKVLANGQPNARDGEYDSEFLGWSKYRGEDREENHD